MNLTPYERREAARHAANADGRGIGLQRHVGKRRGRREPQGCAESSLMTAQAARRSTGPCYSRKPRSPALAFKSLASLRYRPFRFVSKSKYSLTRQSTESPLAGYVSRQDGCSVRTVPQTK